MPTLRTLSDLRSLFPVSHEPAVLRGQGPLIPCANCGAVLRYRDAVARVFSDEYAGFCHPVGECDPEVVTKWKAYLVIQAEQNERGAERQRLKFADARRALAAVAS